MDIKYIPVIGLEIHIELNTKSKMFCNCSADWFGQPANSNTCPVCLGLPGALPVPNRTAIESTIKLGLALESKINLKSKFDRKNYFYPDLPKSYQISQYDQPFAIAGNYKLQKTNSKHKIINITRVHLEEDTGKLIHQSDFSMVDFNRSGVPLVEIVTEPDFNNSTDVKKFLEELQILIRYLGISDADMEKGSMRLEPNISLRKIQNSNNEIRNKFEIQKNSNNNKTKLPNSPTRLKLPNYKVEVKNINSFRFCQKAIEYEIKRQTELLDKGIIPLQETRGWDENKQKTISQRTKEEAHDYRYFPEPDIPPFKFNNEYINKIRQSIPELPVQRIQRYINDYSLKPDDAHLIVKNKKVADYFDQINSKFKVLSPKSKLKIQNYENKIASLIINKRISTDLTKKDFINKIIDLLTPKQYTVNYNLTIEQVIQKNPNPVKDYKSGKENAIMFLVGQVMKELKGQGDPQTIKKILINKLK